MNNKRLRNTLDGINPIISILRTLIAFSLYCLFFFLDYTALSRMREYSFVWVIVWAFVLFRMSCNVVYLFVKLESEILNRKPRRVIMIGYLGIRSALWLLSDLALMALLINWYALQTHYEFMSGDDNYLKMYLIIFIIFTFMVYSLQYLIVRRIALYDTNFIKNKIFKWTRPVGIIILLFTTFPRVLFLFLPKSYFSEDLNLFKMLFLGFYLLVVFFLLLAFEIYPLILQILYYNNVELKKELFLGKNYKRVEKIDSSDTSTASIV